MRPEFLILFKAKAYLDLRIRKENGDHVDSRDIKKHKNDILRIASELLLEKIGALPETIHTDLKEFIVSLEEEPFDANLLQSYGLGNGELVGRLRRIYGV